MKFLNYLFSTRLKKLRIEKKYSQQLLAESIGASQSLVSAYERGTKLPTYESLWRIADLFSVTTDYLLGREKETRQVDESYSLFVRMNEVETEEGYTSTQQQKEIAKDLFYYNRQMHQGYNPELQESKKEEDSDNK